MAWNSPPGTRPGQAAPLDLSVRELFRQLAAIEETVLVYPSTGGRTKARRMTTELTGNQPQLYEIFGLNRWTPRSQVIGASDPETLSHLQKHDYRSTQPGNSG